MNNYFHKNIGHLLNGLGLMHLLSFREWESPPKPTTGQGGDPDPSDINVTSIAAGAADVARLDVLDAELSRCVSLLKG